MIQIRNSVFETNSSSSHSISIRKNKDYYTEEEILDSFYETKWDDWDERGKIHFWSMDLEFGRSPFEPLTSFRDKVRYAIASYGMTDPNRIEEIIGLLYEKISGLRVVEFDKHLNYDDEEEIDYGYVDHESIDILESFLTSHNITLREFLLNSKYIIFVDGDEYCITEKLFDSGLINKDDFEETMCR